MFDLLCGFVVALSLVSFTWPVFILCECSLSAIGTNTAWLPAGLSYFYFSTSKKKTNKNPCLLGQFSRSRILDLIGEENYKISPWL